jgi:hypothetical protein
MLKTGERSQNDNLSAEGAIPASSTRHRVVVAGSHARGRSRPSSKSRVAAKHGNTRAVLGSAQRNHVLTDVTADNLAMLGAAVCQNVLDEVVSELVARNCTRVSEITS